MNKGVSFPLAGPGFSFTCLPSFTIDRPSGKGEKRESRLTKGKSFVLVAQGGGATVRTNKTVVSSGGDVGGSGATTERSQESSKFTQDQNSTQIQD
ncbi:hypothetical protein RUM43_011751 [Polyplax serrata]|uniref:Uncharacterized protein n=1 Tax=Polyplax serrata TaxID=468196 RepID=A0AAN8S7D3_POLSC